MAEDTPTALLIEPAKRRKPKETGRRPVVEREGNDLQRTLRLYDRLREISELGGDPKLQATLEELAWVTVREAEPIRILHAEQLLGLTNQTIHDWIERGILEEQGSSPKRVSLESALRAKLIVNELREQGQDRDLISSVLNKLEFEELQEDDRFRRSLEQMKRGERGEWPEDF